MSIYRLGYSIHSIEPSFTSQENTVNPEAIAHSPTRQHTLLTEWTAAQSLSYEKKEQIRRYLLVNASELETNAGVPLDACSSCRVSASQTLLTQQFWGSSKTRRSSKVLHWGDEWD